MLGLVLHPPVKIAPPTAPALPETEVAEVVGVLTEARALIARRWCSGQWDDGKGGYCARSALRLGSALLYGACHPAETRAVAALAATLRIQPTDIPKWNDRPWRTRRSVLRAFDRTLERLQA